MTSEPLGGLLEVLCAEASREVVLCAPFAKARVVERLLSRLESASVVPLLITRWRPEEVAAGVSDLGVLDVLARAGGRVVLHNHLHAKYFRSEARALLGSANLTSTALGWYWPANLELLTGVPISDVIHLEKRLLQEGVVADQALAAEVDRLASQLEIPRMSEPETIVAPPAGGWVPSLRYPQDLYEAYSQGLHELSGASALAAAHDLLALARIHR